MRVALAYHYYTICKALDKANEQLAHFQAQQDKKEADERKSDIDRAKLMQAKDIAEDKMDQNEKLAKLRAGVSLAKAEKPGITAIEVED